MEMHSKNDPVKATSKYRLFGDSFSIFFIVKLYFQPSLFIPKFLIHTWKKKEEDEDKKKKVYVGKREGRLKEWQTQINNIQRVRGK